ncbi:hypothetical protein BDQ17DRAFT_1333622 [Cyathus striatus]|nr:hypothetical protein BDQ17DRAFT_1333622 [Cyathus striatus]
MVHVTSAVLVAAIVAAPAFAAPLSSDSGSVEARSGSGGRAAKEVVKNVVEGYGQNTFKDAVKKYTNPPVQVPDGLKEAARKHTSGFSKDAVNHVTGHKKRALDFDELYARSGSGGRAAKEVVKNVVEGYGQNTLKDAVKKYTNPPIQVPDGLKEAARKHTSGFSKDAVNHVTGHKKRALDFDEFYSRSGSGGRAAKEVVKNVVEGYGQNTFKDAIKKYTNPPVQVPDGLKEAARKYTSGFSKDAVNHVTGHKKRSLDFDEFYARSGSGGRAAKEVVKNVVEGYGQNTFKDAVKKYTNPPVQVPDGLKEAARKHTSEFSKDAVNHVTGHKRSLDDMDMYERDFEDFEDVFERDLFDGSEERDFFDELEEREFYELNELD